METEQRTAPARITHHTLRVEYVRADIVADLLAALEEIVKHEGHTATDQCLEKIVKLAQSALNAAREP